MPSFKLRLLALSNALTLFMLFPLLTQTAFLFGNAAHHHAPLTLNRVLAA